LQTTTDVKGTTDHTTTDLDTKSDLDTTTDPLERLGTTPLEMLLPETLPEVVTKTGEVVVVVVATMTALDTEQKFPCRKRGDIRLEMVTLPCDVEQGHSRVFLDMFVFLD
jgi:hypothetical protein